ncbi:hypothetical protein FS749_001312 [Ceratobasidium sp. UAMH 11750]|nr:hypothetical protein FS749_001312 [Ceratobasidium sp. UAMH 11750]
MPPKKKPEKRQLDVGSDGSDSDDPRPSKRLVLAPDADLPQSTRITFDQSEWLEQFREPFRNAIKPRGTKKDSATEYVYNTLTIPFIEKFFPQLNKEQVRRFRDCQWKPIYTWLSNHSSRDENAAKVPGSGQRFVVGWHWYADNKPEIKQQWREYCRDDDKKHLHSSIHHFRKFTLDLFAAQPPEVQLRYKNLTEELKQNASSRKELDPKSVEAALKDALHRLTTMGKGLESKFGITLMAQLGTPVAKTMRVVQAGSSTGLQFVLGEQGKAIGNAFGDWLVERFGGPQERSGSPQPAVMPDRIDNNHPMMPDVPEDIVTLMLARSWVRVFWSGRWQYDGGHDSVPYSLIAADPDRWVDPKRCPKGVPFKEAGQLNLAQCLEWVRHLSGRRNGTVDKEAEFGFRQILTANLDTYPTCPEVIERTQFVRNGRPVWLVRFSRLVEQPQNKKPIYYKRSSWLYFYHCEHERDPTISGTPGLAHWSGLPTRPADMDAGNGRFSHDEMNLIKSWFKNCEDGVKDLVDNIMAEVNVMEDRLPIWVSVLFCWLIACFVTLSAFAHSRLLSLLRSPPSCT